MKRELRCACHGQLLGYEVTPGDDNTGPVTEPPRYADWPYRHQPGEAVTADVLKYGYTFKMYVPIDVRIDPDPLGDINCIIRMLRRSDGEVLKSVLHTNTPGLEPKIGYGIPIHPKGGFGFTWQLPGWYVEVDGERLMEIPEGAIGPRIPLPVKPWHQRAHRAVRNRFRDLADAAAKHLGYTRSGECCCDD